MPDPRGSAPEHDEFFVGWMPHAPTGIARRARWLASALVGAAIAAGVLATATQNAPVPSVWEDAATVLDGVLICDPYPRLVTARADNAGPRHVLLVAQGKFGLIDPADYCGGDLARPAPDPDRDALIARMKAMSGMGVRVSGTLLRRGRGEMLEVQTIESNAAVAAGISPAAAVAATARPFDLREADLVGEIVDPKCFYGAMKPGEGKTHRACAARCVAGGISPVLVVRDGVNPDRCLVLTTDDGSAFNARVIAAGLVGEPVRVRGRVLSLGGIEFVRVADGGLFRR